MLVAEKKTVEEFVDDSPLLIGYTRIVFLCVKDDSEGGRDDTIFSFLGEVDGVHLEVESLTVDGVFGAGVQMELNAIEFTRTHEVILRNV